MEADVITVTREKAEKELADLKQLFKTHGHLKDDKTYRDLQRAYGHMKHGGKIIDVHKAIVNAGLNDKGHPKIAIVRADAKICYLTKYTNRMSIFSGQPPPRWGYYEARKCYGEIALPQGAFEWLDKNGKKARYTSDIAGNQIKTIVPLIPPAILIDKVRYALKNYYLLWEVESWDLMPPIDPMLLKRLNDTLFCVLATWDLTELERAIIKANIE